MEPGTITALLSAGLAIAGILLKAWVANKPQRDQEKHDEETQRGRSDIQEGNVSAVESRIDRDIDGVLPVPARGINSAAGLESAADVERRISEL